MESVSPFDAQHLEAVARVFGDTGGGLSGSEIARILQQCGMTDCSPTMSKWARLFNAFVEAQRVHRVGNHVVMFINKAMNPVRYTNSPGEFATRRDRLNAVLAFSGVCVGDDGRARWSTPASNLDEALQRASHLHAALIGRGVHPDVLRHCKAELLKDNNYFHAVLEAAKSVAAKLRLLSGLSSDGASLVMEALGLPKDGSSPLLAVNSLSTETEKGEQRGFVNLLVGFFGTVRNPLAHSPKIEWPMDEADALDILTLASLIHRKLDRATRLER